VSPPFLFTEQHLVWKDMQGSCFLLVHANRYFVMMYRLQILSFGEKIDVECVSLTYISRDFTTTQMVSKLHKKVKASKSVECLSGARAPTTLVGTAALHVCHRR
jgi:hypothetical protein